MLLPPSPKETIVEMVRSLLTSPEQGSGDAASRATPIMTPRTRCSHGTPFSSVDQIAHNGLETRQKGATES